MHRDPVSGLDFVPLPANVVPLNVCQFVPTSTPQPTNSLDRVPDLNRFLDQCDDSSYKNNYLQLLQSAPPEMRFNFLKSLRDRSQWLDGHQETEYTRSKQFPIAPAPLLAALHTKVNNTYTGAHLQQQPYTMSLQQRYQQQNIVSVGVGPQKAAPSADQEDLIMSATITPQNMEVIVPVKKERNEESSPVEGQMKVLKRKR